MKSDDCRVLQWGKPNHGTSEARVSTVWLSEGVLAAPFPFLGSSSCSSSALYTFPSFKPGGQKSHPLLHTRFLFRFLSTTGTVLRCIIFLKVSRTRGFCVDFKYVIRESREHIAGVIVSDCLSTCLSGVINAGDGPGLPTCRTASTTSACWTWAARPSCWERWRTRQVKFLPLQIVKGGLGV